VNKGWAAADTDRDGFLSRDDFAPMCDGVGLPSGQASDLITSIDADKDGRVSQDEYKDYMKKNNAKQLLQRLDADSDGRISLGEYKDLLRKIADKAT